MQGNHHLPSTYVVLSHPGRLGFQKSVGFGRLGEWRLQLQVSSVQQEGEVWILLSSSPTLGLGWEPQLFSCRVHLWVLVTGCPPCFSTPGVVMTHPTFFLDFGSAHQPLMLSFLSAHNFPDTLNSHLFWVCCLPLNKAISTIKYYYSYLMIISHFI